MAKSLITSTGTATTRQNMHMVDFDQYGNCWVAVLNTVDNRYEFWAASALNLAGGPYEVWVESPTLRIDYSNAASPAFAINRHLNVAAFLPDGEDSSAQSNLRICPNFGQNASWIDVGERTLDGDSSYLVDLIIIPKPSSTNFYVAVTSGKFSSGGVDLDMWEFTSSGTKVGDKIYNGFTVGGGNNQSGSLDWNHNGDGSTPNGDPDFYVATWHLSDYVYFRKFTWDGVGGWTAGTFTQIETGVDARNPFLYFDGSRAIFSMGTASDMRVYERDADETYVNTLFSGSPGYIETLKDSQVFGDGKDNIYLVVSGTITNKIHYKFWDRATDTWDASWTPLDVTLAVDNSLGAGKHRFGSRNVVTWVETAGGVYSEVIAWNTAPLAPTWLTPTSGTQQPTTPLSVTWQFNDNDTNDQQGAYAIKRTISAVTTYYDAATSSWSESEVQNFSLVEGATLIDWGNPSDNVDLYVKTWDVSNAEGPYSAALNLTGAANLNAVQLEPESSYFVLLQTKGGTGSPAYSFLSLEQEVPIFTRRVEVPVELTDNDYLTAPLSRVVRYVDVYESDGVTPWRLRLPVTTGSISIEASPTSKRSCSLELVSRTVDYETRYEIDDESGIWYDKIVKVYRGVMLPDEVERVWPLGVFHIDTLSDQNFPSSITLQGRDKFKVLEQSKFAQPTQFGENLNLFDVVRAIAVNAGIQSISMPSDVIPLGYDWLFEQNTSRAEAIESLVESFGYTVLFDASGTLIAEKIPDPYAGALEYSFTTGESGNMISWKRSASDADIYNRVIVVGESSSTLPVYGDAKNTDPGSPTRISRIGERVLSLNLSSVTTTEQAQDLAERLLAVRSLEQFDINVASLVVPWLNAGDIIEVLVESDSLNSKAPTRFLLSNLTIPLGLEPMSLTGRRLAIVG